MTIHEKAYAKLNITLGVRGKRADGYHELDMLMQTVSLCDYVTLEKANGVVVTVTGMHLPYNNTLRKAAEYYYALTGKGAVIRVRKEIPSQAGLGGGSADAAAVLRGLDRLYGETDQETLREIALKVGADVPFCLYGGLCRAEGVGEILTGLPGSKLYTVITKPSKGVSTKALFQNLTLPRKAPETMLAASALMEGDLDLLGNYMFNALQEPAEKLVPEICEHIRRLKDAGAVAAQMTGSGSAVFGLFRSKEDADMAAEKLADLPFCTVAESTGAIAKHV